MRILLGYGIRNNLILFLMNMFSFQTTVKHSCRSRKVYILSIVKWPSNLLHVVLVQTNRLVVLQKFFSYATKLKVGDDYICSFQIGKEMSYAVA